MYSIRAASNMFEAGSAFRNRQDLYTKDYTKDKDVICLPVYMLPFI